MFSPSRPIAWRTKFNTHEFFGQKLTWMLISEYMEARDNFEICLSQVWRKFRNSIHGSGRAFEVWFKALWGQPSCIDDNSYHVWDDTKVTFICNNFWQTTYGTLKLKLCGAMLAFDVKEIRNEKRVNDNTEAFLTFTDLHLRGKIVSDYHPLYLNGLCKWKSMIFRSKGCLSCNNTTLFNTRWLYVQPKSIQKF